MKQVSESKSKRRVGKALRATGSTLMGLTLSLLALSACSGAGEGESELGVEVAHTEQAIDPCAQCYVRYNGCVKLANERFGICLKTCTSQSVCMSQHASELRACQAQLDACTYNHC
ncbi:MAG TPA: hypothetical protein VFQ35_25800 [Polyangiaceae bacterium]|nr:hypothetical protein [Polyangiaceae bacterium]